MKFFRLTSVFLCCALLSSFLILPASATDDDDFYSLPSVGASDPSIAFDSPVSPADFSDSDSATLSSIYRFVQYITTSPSSWGSNSIIGFLEKIFDRIPSNLSVNFRLLGGEGTNDILDSNRDLVRNLYNYVSSDNIAGNLGNIQRNTLASADRLLSTNTVLNSIFESVSGIHGFATERTLASLLASSQVLSGDVFNPVLGSISTKQPGYAFPLIKDREYVEWMSFPWVISSLYSNFSYDGFLPYHSAADEYTLYHWVKNLSQTLASEDDKKLAESQKENREQIEKDFLTGKSDKTSLGKDDFGSLSSVGGTFKDAISLNGQSSISDLTSGLSDADTAGQGWFSQATKDSLDAVSGSTSSESTVSTFSDDGLYSVDVDSDPYHMQGFEDNYAWLWGDD